MKKIAIGLAVVLLVSGGAFYGGTVYGKNNARNSARRTITNGNPQAGNFQGRVGGGAGGNIERGGGMVNGEILSKTENTITVKLRDGGSKLVIFSNSTPVRKTVDTGVDELQTGKSITVNGTANADGSVTAQLIQLRTSSTPAFGNQNQ